jgi:hypothetical protein
MKTRLLRCKIPFPFSDMPNDPENFRYSGWTGSERCGVNVTRLTRFGHGPRQELLETVADG